MLIREERADDCDAVGQVHAGAFPNRGDSVVSLARELRQTLLAEPGLSLVACEQDVVVGHALFSRNLLDAHRGLVDVQVLSPLGVAVGQQRRGIGTALVTRGLAILTERGVPAVFLEGCPAFYQRIGFRAGGELGFRRPSLRIPEAAFMVRLLPAYEPWMTGTLVYRSAFWDHDAVGLRA